MKKKGTILIQKTNLDDELFLNDLLEIGIENFEEFEDEYQLIIEPDDFENTTKLLEDKDYDLEGDLSLIPINTVTISNTQLDQISKLLNILEEHDDVQKVHTNLAVDN